MDFDFFEFDGALVDELYALLDPQLTLLKSQVDPDYPEEATAFEAIEHINGIAAVAAQRFISVTSTRFGVAPAVALSLGPTIETTTKIAAINAAANFWKHSDDGFSAIRPATKSTLEAAGIDFEVGDELGHLVTNIFYRCGYGSLRGISGDLKSWMELVIENA